MVEGSHAMSTQLALMLGGTPLRFEYTQSDTLQPGSTVSM